MWIHKGKIITTAPEDTFGFVYIITCIDKTSDKYGWIYVGKKFFNLSVKKKITKKVKKETKTRKKIERVLKDSGWLNYFGSSLSLKENVKLLGEDAFKREIICFCKNKAQLSYMEVVYQIKYDVLLKPSWNNWISCKIFKTHLNK